MSAISDLLWRRLNTFDPASPLNLLDLFLVVSLLIGSLIYIQRFALFRVLLGTVLLVFLAFGSILIGFTLTGLLLAFVSAIILASLPLIFAPEIRHYLDKLGRFSYVKNLPFLPPSKNSQFVQNLVGAVFELSEQKIGALIIIQRRTSLGDLIDSGVLLNAHLGSKILGSIFQHQSPLHDGAVVIADNQILAARCIVPASPDVKLDPPFGTRHKAGLSISRDTDALSIIISEERREISVATGGKLEINLSRAQLSTRLTQLLV